MKTFLFWASLICLIIGFAEKGRAFHESESDSISLFSNHLNENPNPIPQVKEPLTVAATDEEDDDEEGDLESIDDEADEGERTEGGEEEREESEGEEQEEDEHENEIENQPNHAEELQRTQGEMHDEEDDEDEEDEERERGEHTQTADGAQDGEHGIEVEQKRKHSKPAIHRRRIKKTPLRRIRIPKKTQPPKKNIKLPPSTKKDVHPRRGTFQTKQFISVKKPKSKTNIISIPKKTKFCLHDCGCDHICDVNAAHLASSGFVNLGVVLQSTTQVHTLAVAIIPLIANRSLTVVPRMVRAIGNSLRAARDAHAGLEAAVRGAQKAVGRCPTSISAARSLTAVLRALGVSTDAIKAAESFRSLVLRTSPTLSIIPHSDPLERESRTPSDNVNVETFLMDENLVNLIDRSSTNKADPGTPSPPQDKTTNNKQ